jgi:hypothetical protein
MNADKQRIAIAEACGHKRRPQHNAVWAKGGMKIHTTQNLPDYLNDLNDMHEAENVLKPNADELDCNDGKYVEYCKELCRVCGWSQHERTMFAWEVIRATAAQRAEAFLRTIGKWEDDDARDEARHRCGFAGEPGDTSQPEESP